MKFILASAILIAITFGCKFFNNGVSVYNVQEVDFTTLNETIYLKHKARGMNYEEIVISPDKKHRRKPNADRDYVYTWDEILFYKKSKDTLYIYCSHRAKLPAEFRSDVVVIQQQYSNPEFVYQLQKNYHDMGLEKFPKD